MPWLTGLAASRDGLTRRRLLLCGPEKMASAWSITEHRMSQ